MALEMVERKKKEILDHLKDDAVSKIYLVGESGLGKTWMAREVSDYAISTGLSGCNIWLFRKKKYDRSSICKDIVRQFSALLSVKEKPGTGFDKAEGSGLGLGLGLVSFLGSRTGSGSVPGSARQCMEADAQKILKEKILALARKQEKFLLLILDDLPNDENVSEIDLKVKALYEDSVEVTVKILITCQDPALGNEESAKVVKIKPLDTKDSLTLFSGLLTKGFSTCRDIDRLSEEIVKKSKGLPGAIVAAAKALNWAARENTKPDVLQMALEEAANDAGQLLRLRHEALPTSQMVTCCWHGQELFRDRGSVHFSEVIAHWILEGYLGQVESIEKAYMEGHGILIELINRGLMKIAEDNLIAMEGLDLALPDDRERGFCGESNLGLARVFGDGESEGFGTIARTEGMVKLLSEQKIAEPVVLVLDGDQYTKDLTEPLKDEVRGISLFNARFGSAPESLHHAQKLLVLRGSDWLKSVTELRDFKSLTVLEISGAGSLEEMPDDLFREMVDIRSLNLSGTGIKVLPTSFSNLSKLQWLVLSNCSNLETLPSLRGFKNLEVLNLSRASSLKRIHDLSFTALEKLQFLDLSYTLIDRLPFIHDSKSLTRLFLQGCSNLFRVPALPPSLQVLDLSNASILMEIFQLPHKSGDLRVLNLSGCSDIEKLPSTKSFEKLESLDLSGATGLRKIQDESFDHLSCLEVLNLSETKVEGLPSLTGLGNLRKLLLRSCGSLRTLPAMEGLSRLEELDLSGSSSLTKLDPEHLNHKNLRKLLLACCDGLTEIPSLKDLEKLEVLDLSGCTSLAAIQADSFDGMSRLQRLDISSTSIEELPSLVNLRSLRHLFLLNCAKLKSIPGFESLSMLREIDLCGVTSLPDSVVCCDSLKNKTSLEKLDLSGTGINQLPSFSSLTQLLLGGCSGIAELPNLEEMKHLKTLDLARTAVENLPKLESLVELRELILRDCLGIEQLQSLTSLVRLEVLDIWGTRIGEFPYWTQELNHLKRLHLPDLGSVEVDWSSIRQIPEELNWEECRILKTPGIVKDDDSPEPSFISISGTKFFGFLERNPELWETSFKRFRFSVFPPGGNQDIYRYRDGLGFQDIYLELRNFPPREEIGRLLEVHGLDNFSEDLNRAFWRAEYLSFSNISCLSCLSDLEVDAVKGCWLEKCDGLEMVFGGNKDDRTTGQNAETLWLSNLPKLSSLYSESLPSGTLQNLTKLYIDCCPRLERVFSPSQNPKSLQVLHISFCEALVTVFENDSPEQGRDLEKPLLELYLFELPMLERVGVKAQFLGRAEYMGCPRLPPGIISESTGTGNV